jgi:tetratricopeptide (TPR) repeat protein
MLSRAWAGLADTYVLLPLYARMAPATAWPHAKAAAQRAIALDSSSAEAYTSLAYGTMLYEWDWAGSEGAFRRALAADSTYPTAHHWYADYLAGRGRLEESLAEMKRAQALDPLSRIITSEVVWLSLALHRLDEADSTLTRLMRLDPNYAQSLLILGQLRIEQRRYPEAIAALRRALQLDGESPHGSGSLVAAYARSGDRASARALLDSLRARSAHEYVPPFVFAIGYANLGELDRAFAEIDRGIRERDVLLPENFFEPLLDPLKRDPRYPGVVARIGGVKSEE